MHFSSQTGMDHIGRHQLLVPTLPKLLFIMVNIVYTVYYLVVLSLLIHQ